MLEEHRHAIKACELVHGFEEQGKRKYLAQESEQMVVGVAQKLRSPSQIGRDGYRSRGVSRCDQKWKVIIGFCRGWKQEENGVRTKSKGRRSHPKSPVKGDTAAALPFAPSHHFSDHQPPPDHLGFVDPFKTIPTPQERTSSEF